MPMCLMPMMLCTTHSASGASLTRTALANANELKTLTESGVKSFDLNSLPSASTASFGLYQDAQRVQASYYSQPDGTLSQIGSFILPRNLKAA